MLIAYIGIVSLLGPAPRPNPIAIINRGEVAAGMRASEALSKLGKPTQSAENPDGSFTLTFIRTVMDGDVAQHQATVEVDATGVVTSARVERVAITQQGTPPVAERGVP